MDGAVYVGIATFALAVIAYAIKLTWQVSGIEKDAQQYTEAQIDNLRRDMQTLERESFDRWDSLGRETGEMGTALRTKIHEFETWSRDQFVRKDSFESAMARLEKSFEKTTDKLAEKIDRLLARGGS